MQFQGASAATSRAIDHGIALPQILSTWADLIEDQRKDRNSSFAIHARAAAARLRTLERVAIAAARLVQTTRPRPGEEDAMNSLRSALAACDRDEADAAANRANGDTNTH